ncbi:MAG: acetyl-CoA carboxylase biotin carboxyl carrier protein [candidate division WOR-3 bacterium]
MNIKFIKNLINVLEKSNIEEIEIQRFWTRIRLTKNKQEKSSLPKTKTLISETIEVKEKEEKKVEEKPIKEEVIKEDKDLHIIRSPMVGTFYQAPSPDAPPYVEVGDVVKKGDVVCIIEAMKIMNEIESDVRGEIVEILVSNEQPVEYNQPLFVVRKL